MTAKTTRAARIEVLAQLKELQVRWKQEWLDRSIPDDWDFIEERYPVTRKKTKLTVTLDEGMVRWFRKLGRGYQARINGILRVYWQGLLSGTVQSHWEEERNGAQYVEYQEQEAAKMLSNLDMLVREGVLSEEQAEEARQATLNVLKLTEAAAKVQNRSGE